MACVTPLSEPKYASASVVYELVKPRHHKGARSRLGCWCSTGVQPMSAKGSLAASAVGCVACKVL